MVDNGLEDVLVEERVTFDLDVIKNSVRLYLGIWPLVWQITAGVFLGFVVLVAGFGRLTTASAGWVFAFSIIILYFLRIRSRTLAVETGVKSLKAQGEFPLEVLYRFDQHSIYTEVSYAYSCSEWSRIGSWKIDNKVCLIIYSACVYEIIPIDQISPESKDFLVSKLTEFVGPPS